MTILDFAEQALTSGQDSAAAVYVELRHKNQTRWGVGIDTSVLTASIQAVISAVNRARTCNG
ncbi:MAG: hypothetical protein M3P83_11805 [Actinomycetota bacterium]|nr:hypothetical protein [Actinomycetota bacterium]